MTQSSMATIGILSILWMLNPVMAAGVIDPYQNEGNALSFTLKDLDNTPHKLEDYRGKVVLVKLVRPLHQRDARYAAPVGHHG